MPTTKYITDMTDQEILALTDDDLKRMIQLKMLEEGIKILVRPEEPQYAEVPAKDLSGFCVKVGYSHDHIYYANRESAERVIVAIRAEQDSLRKYDYISSYSTSYEHTFSPYDPEPEITVEETRVYSRGLFDQVRDALTGNKKLKDAYEKQLKEYKGAEEAAAWIRDEVNNCYYEVTSKYREFESMLAKFQEYLQLADNDSAQASVFFEKAYHPEKETRQYLSEKSSFMLETPETTPPAEKNSEDDE